MEVVDGLGSRGEDFGPARAFRNQCSPSRTHTRCTASRTRRRRKYCRHCTCRNQCTHQRQVVAAHRAVSVAVDGRRGQVVHERGASHSRRSHGRMSSRCRWSLARRHRRCHLGEMRKCFGRLRAVSVVRKADAGRTVARAGRAAALAVER
eukprot:6008847-Prymnesium_polylepis.1